MGFFDMQEKAGTDLLNLKDAQKKNSQAEAAAGLKASGRWKYFEKEFLKKEKLEADKGAMEKDGEERHKAQGVREFMQRMEAWFAAKTSKEVGKENIDRLKTLASGQH